MRGPRSEHGDLLLIVATAILTLTAQHYFQARVTPEATPAALAPPEIPRCETRKPASGSWDILVRTWQRFNDDRLLATAAGVVFFGLLAVFPAVTALVSFYGLFADPSTIGANLQTLSLMLPDGSFAIVQDQIGRVLAKGNASLGWTFLFGVALALWSANAGIKAVIDALNVVYEQREERSFIRLNLIALAFTVGGILALLLMVSVVVAFPLALNHLGLPADRLVAISLARWPLMFAVLLIALAVLYRFGPDRPEPRWELLGVGTWTAAVLWIAGSAALSWYLSNFGNYDATYGSLGAAIGLMTWMWMSATIVLFGAELNAEMEQRRATPDTPRRRL